MRALTIRPAAVSPWPQAFLAGDWVATGWPATMEGAVRSGYLAAEAVSRAAGKPAYVVFDDKTLWLIAAGGTLSSPAEIASETSFKCLTGLTMM